MGWVFVGDRDLSKTRKEVSEADSCESTTLGNQVSDGRAVGGFVRCAIPFCPIPSGLQRLTIRANALKIKKDIKTRTAETGLRIFFCEGRQMLTDAAARAKRQSALRRMTQLISWLGLKQVDQTFMLRHWFWRALVRAALVVLPSIAMTACEATRPFERSADGSVVYLDQLSDEQKAAARDKIVRTLDRGLEVYTLQIGDEFEVFFDVKRQPTAGEYAISVGDKLAVDFIGDAANSKVVLVRPDGWITMPLIGPIMAAGKTVDKLTRDIDGKYTGQLTINVAESHSRLEDFLEVVSPTGVQRSIRDKVLPDGTVSLPLLQPIQARDRSLRALEHDIDKAYAALHLDISATLVPRSLHPGSVLVLGEIAKPGRIDSDRPMTVLMAIAQAGGVTIAGSIEAVRVFYIDADHEPHLRSVNLKDEIDGLRLDEDMIVPPNSVIYVPPTELAKTGRFLDSVLRDILRFQGFSIGGTYLINNPNSGGTTVVPAAPQ
jgi:protein involved in polysaccharide export with SLBB domain